MSARRFLWGFAAALTLGAGVDPARAEGSIELLSPGQFAALIEREHGNAVVVNLWATWCVPCLEEIPVLMQLGEEFAGDELTLLAVGMDDPGDLARVDAFRAQHFPGFKSYLRASADMDSLVSVIDPAWNELLPTTYLIDADGAVVKRIQGKRSRDEFRDEFRALTGDDRGGDR